MNSPPGVVRGGEDDRFRDGALRANPAAFLRGCVGFVEQEARNMTRSMGVWGPAEAWALGDAR